MRRIAAVKKIGLETHCGIVAVRYKVRRLRASS
jgi:hypothetical protein